MALTEIKKQVVLMLQSVLSLDSSGRTEAMGFLKDCATNFGLTIPEGEESNDTVKVSNNNILISDPDSVPLINFVKDADVLQNNIGSNKEKGINGYSSTNESDEKVFPDDTFQCNSSLNVEAILKSNEENGEEEEAGKNNVMNKKTKSKQKQNNVKNFLDVKSVKKCDTVKKVGIKKSVSSLKKIEVETKKRRRKMPAVKNECETGHDNGDEGKNEEGHEDENKEDDENESSAKSENNNEDENENEIFKCPGCMVTCKNKPALLLHFSSHPKVPMSCRLCRSSFNNILNFWRHQKKKKCKISLFKCSECSEKFKYRRHYLKHVLGHNDNNCRYCDEKFSTWLLYKHHLKKKHPDIKMERDLIPCKFCAMSFRRHLGLYNHYQIEHSKGKFVCLSCGLLLPTKEKYKEHALVHESEKSWKCKICKMKFYRRQQLLFHVSVHKSGTYKCLTCDITVTSKADLYKHKKDGHEVKGLEPKFKCEICHKNFKKKVVLKNHMATHSKEKKYYCKYCVKSFSTLDALQKHQKRKSHFEKAKIILPESKYEKVYEDKLICESCGKQYKTQRELTWHLRVHKSIYECHECGKTFTLKVNLTKHIRLHRNKVCVVCELCGNTFNQLSALNEHYLMKHSDVRNAECEVCKKKFKRKSELNRHMRIHEQKRPFACFCGTAFKQSSHLQTHYKNFHEKTAEQSTLIQNENFTNSETNEMFNETIIDRKPMYVNGEQATLLPLENIEAETTYRNTSSYDNIQVNENHESKAPYGNTYSLRYPQNEITPINVTYEEISFGASQQGKRELVFTSPAVDLSMVAISEVVQSDMALEGPRDITESVAETFNKIPDDASNIQLVNLSEHIVQEYLLNLP